jgi:spore coat protein U-like protein
MRRLVAGTAVAGILGTLAVSHLTVQAATLDATLNVSANVAAKCTFSAPNTLAFGTYDPVTDHATADLDASANLRVACTKGAPSVWIGFETTGREMSNGTETLTYELYTDSGRNDVWGDTSGTGYSYTAASKAETNVPVYGRVAGGQDVSVGNYTDTITATINF